MADNMFRYWNQLSRNIPNNGLCILIFGMNWTNVSNPLQKLFLTCFEFIFCILRKEVKSVLNVYLTRATVKVEEQNTRFRI